VKVVPLYDWFRNFKDYLELDFTEQNNLIIDVLHTVEIVDSNPASPAIFFSTTCVISGAKKSSGVTKTVTIFGDGDKGERAKRQAEGSEPENPTDLQVIDVSD
jgi:hypothetical protein